jgi:hypothetical protein
MFPALLVQVIIILVVVGLALWIIAQIPMDPTIAKILRVVVIVAVCIWLLTLLLNLSGVPVIRR